MSHSLSKLLLLYAQQFEDQHAPQNVTLALREASAEIDKLRGVLQRVRRFGSPMIRGYIDGALGRQAGGSDPLADDQVGENREQGGAGMSDDMDEVQRRTEAAAEIKENSIKEMAYKIDPEAWISYSGKPKEFKQLIDARRLRALNKARAEPSGKDDE